MAGRMPEMQINIMNARVAALVAQDKDRWQLAARSNFTWTWI